MVFSHPPIGTVGLTERKQERDESIPRSKPAGEAAQKYGASNLTIYQSRFIGMYYAVCEHKSKTLMKLVCTGPEEKVFIDIVLNSLMLQVPLAHCTEIISERPC